MLYALLAHHLEAEVASWTKEEDDALMAELNKVHDRLTAEGRMGPAARLDYTASACTLRGGEVFDGPYAETKEQMLGFYLLDVADRDAAVAAARELQARNPGCIYEIRPVVFHLPGADIL
jgi:hypothetical protein